MTDQEKKTLLEISCIKMIRFNRVLRKLGIQDRIRVCLIDFCTTCPFSD